MKLHIFYEDDTLEFDINLEKTVSNLLELISSKIGISATILKLTMRLPNYKVQLIPSQQLSEYSILPTIPLFLKLIRPKKPLVPHRRTQSELSP